MAPDALAAAAELDDRTVAMERPVDAAATPVVPMLDRLEAPANTPLAPPTAEPTGNSTPANGAVDAASAPTLQPPVAH